MEILFLDAKLLVCVKPVGLLSTDEPGGVPEALREQLGDPGAPLYPVHRLDRTVGGLLALARTRRAAGDLGRAVAEGHFHKEYLAVVPAAPTPPAGTLRDWLLRDRARRVTQAVPPETPGAKEAVLDYELLSETEGAALLRIVLRTGRTHQIRAQLAAHGLPLLGDRKYGGSTDTAETPALWCHKLSFPHPKTGEMLTFTCNPPMVFPWTLYSDNPSVSFADSSPFRGAAGG